MTGRLPRPAASLAEIRIRWKKNEPLLTHRNTTEAKMLSFHLRNEVL